MTNWLHSATHSDNRSKFYHQLLQREREWWQARQRLVILRQRQMLWYGDNSFMMWLLWSLISYIVVAIILMLLTNLFAIPLTLWQCASVFGLQTLFYMTLLVFKRRLATVLQQRIDKQKLLRDQAFDEMTILAGDSIFPDIHANAPISLQHIYERYGAQLRRSSLQRLLQKEVDAKRMIVGQYQTKSHVLPLGFADNELIPYASKIVYKSVI